MTNHQHTTVLLTKEIHAKLIPQMPNAAQHLGFQFEKLTQSFNVCNSGV